MSDTCKALRDVRVGNLFTWANPNDPDGNGVYRVIHPTEPGRDRVTVEALSTGMSIIPTMVYMGSERVVEL